MDLKKKIAQAKQNVANLTTEFQRIQTLLVKWQGVVEYLESLDKEAQQGDPVDKPSEKKSK